MLNESPIRGFLLLRSSMLFLQLQNTMNSIYNIGNYYRLVGSLDYSKQLGKLSVHCPSSTRRLRSVAAAAAALYIGYMYASYAYRHTLYQEMGQTIAPWNKFTPPGWCSALRTLQIDSGSPWNALYFSHSISLTQESALYALSCASSKGLLRTASTSPYP